MTEARGQRRGSSARLALAAVAFLACRNGTIAGTGAPCDDRHPCRAGFVCRALSCAPAPRPEEAPDAEMKLPAADAAARRFDVPTEEAPADASASTQPPSLPRCVE